MSKLDIKKEHIGKKIYDIKVGEYLVEHYRVMADSEDEATDIMFDNRFDKSFGDGENILFQGVRCESNEINVEELTTIKEDDFDQYGEEDFECEYDGGYDE